MNFAQKGRMNAFWLVVFLTVVGTGCDALKNKDGTSGSNPGSTTQTEAEITDPVSLFTSTLVGTLEEWNPTQPPLTMCGRANLYGICVPDDSYPRKRLDYGNCLNTNDKMTGSVVVAYMGGPTCLVGTLGRSGVIAYNFTKEMNSGLTQVVTTEPRAIGMNQVIGGGSVLTPMDATLQTWKLSVPGIHYEVKNGPVTLYRDSVYTPSGSEFSVSTQNFARTNRIVHSGILKLMRSATDVQMGSFSDLRFENPSCCFPTSGRLLIQPPGATSYTTEVNYLSKCGNYSIRHQNGRSYTGELTHCGGSAQY
ncbi:MAG: hypothetical protein EOP09_12980 [Proteobacteria bacterium]|nr:MAG: hypothetical protein EOP09_12980 [Pseudomonadota bacterium]